MQDFEIWRLNHSELMQKARAAADALFRAKAYVSIVDVLPSKGQLFKADSKRRRF